MKRALGCAAMLLFVMGGGCPTVVFPVAGPAYIYSDGGYVDYYDPVPYVCNCYDNAYYYDAGYDDSGYYDGGYYDSGYYDDASYYDDSYYYDDGYGDSYDY